MVIIYQCKKCGKVKKFGEFIPMIIEIKNLISKGQISVETIICPDCQRR